MKKLKTNLIWLVYAAFVGSAIYLHWTEDLFTVKTFVDFGKVVFWLAFLAFTAYTIYCSNQENLFKTMKTMSGLHWGKQIGLDLYIGLLVVAFLIYLNHGSFWILLFWLIPLMIFGNLATLLYFALNYDFILAKLLN